jgi:hypothetical protein
VLRELRKAALAAILIPFWLIAVYEDALHAAQHDPRASTSGAALAMLAFTYLSPRIGDQSGRHSAALVWIGGLALIPAIVFSCIADSDWFTAEWIVLIVGSALSPRSGLRASTWAWPDSR